jgi:hypothetical protein
MTVVKADKQVRDLAQAGKSAIEKDPFDRDGDQLTVGQLKRTMPKARQHNVTPELVDKLNRLIDDPNEREAFRENILSYTGVLNDPKITITAYVQAVRYVSYKLMGYSNYEAWIKTFPERYQKMLDKGQTAGYMHSIVAQYNKGLTVNKILEAALVPVWVLNQDLFQKALNVQAELMATAKSEKVRSDAANSLLTHLKQPEATKLSVDVHVKEDDSVRELREATMELVRQQKLAIESGMKNAKEVAESKLIPGEYKRVN